ncbi:MAG: hypothetical protein K6E63_11115 [Lachnospiraceae bacterium]|nr:hypothetical protein [Lachnospiraceae bacterium]
MSVEKSQKILKIFGTLSIIGGVLMLIVGVGAAYGAGMLDEEGKAVALLMGIILIICGIVDLLQGIFSRNAAKDSSKIGPAWIFAIIGLATSVISMISSAIKDPGTIVSGLFSVAISALIFVAANTIKKNA